MSDNHQLWTSKTSIIILSIIVHVSLGAGCGPVDDAAGEPHQLISDMVDVPEVVLQNSGAGIQTFASGVPTVLYLNFEGANIIKGNQSNATTNTSFIGGGNVPPFPGSAADKQQVITLMKQLYASYNIQIVTTRPTSGDYDMAMIGGSPSSIGLNYPSNVAGVAPMDCGNKMRRDIAFIFAGSIKSMYGSSPKFSQRVAETSAHESGHTYGLPHSGVGCDLMSYSTCAQLKTFLDQLMPMQADSYGKCGLTQMNSHQILLGALGATAGPPADTTSPTVAINTPQAGAQVATSLTVKASISDDVGVARGELHVDGKVSSTNNNPPFDFTVNLTAGDHTLKVVGIDAAGNKGSATVTVKAGGSTSGDSVAPVVTITSPAAGSTVSKSFEVKAGVTDNKGVTRVELHADGKLVKSTTAAAPYRFSVTLVDGSHMLKVTGYDAAGNKSSATVSVNVDSSKPSVPPKPAPGTFGAPCNSASDCGSKLCANDSAMGSYCTRTCTDQGGCPGSATCMATTTPDVSVCGAPLVQREAMAEGEYLLGSCSVSSTGATRVGLTPALLLLLLTVHCWRRRR